MPRFNIGDRVKVTESVDSDYSFCIGLKGIIYRIDIGDPENPYFVGFKRKDIPRSLHQKMEEWMQCDDYDDDSVPQMFYLYFGSSELRKSKITKREREKAIVAKIHELNDRYSRHMKAKGLESCLSK